MSANPTATPKRVIDGWVNLDKPLNMSSARAVAIAKRLTNAAKVGHAGTLDPLATGVLPLVFGKATKQVNLLMDASKTYRFCVTFGERRTTDDAEGEVVATSAHIPNENETRTILSQFIGEIEQIPPVFSALKVGGKRAYDLARQGQEVMLNPRRISIYQLQLLELNGRIAKFEASVSKGTYIRSLGRDIAQAVGSEGYISYLHRCQVGRFTDTDAISLDFLEKNVHNPAAWLHPLFPSGTALDGIPAHAPKPDAA